LSTDGLRAGHIWQLLSFQFLHGGLMHLFFNLLTLWFFGRPVEERLGSRSFLKLYFISGAAGGLLQAGLGLLARNYFGHTTYGASAGICGIISAFALIEPNAEIRLWCVLPIKAKHLLWFGGGIALFFTLVPSDSGVAHAAHLGGYLAGIAYMRWDAARSAVNWNPLQGRRRKRQLVQAAAQITRWRGAREQSAGELPPEEFISREVDPILDKISAHGIHSLTPRERQILEAARAKMAKK
jgi:membrane associated rhomboid family serine protease